MNVNIQTQGFALTPSIGSRVHERINSALDRYGQDVVSIDVFLRDINGPKGGEDKQGNEANGDRKLWRSGWRVTTGLIDQSNYSLLKTYRDLTY